MNSVSIMYRKRGDRLYFVQIQWNEGHLVLMDREQMSEEESLLLPILIGEHEARWWKRHMFEITNESSVVDYSALNDMIHFGCSFERFSQTVEMVHHRFIARSRDETPILRIAIEKDTQHRWTPCSVLIETHLPCSFEARRGICPYVPSSISAYSLMPYVGIHLRQTGEPVKHSWMIRLAWSRWSKSNDIRAISLPTDACDWQVMASESVLSVASR